MTDSRRIQPARRFDFLFFCLSLVFVGAATARADVDAAPFSGPEQRGGWRFALTLNAGGGVDDTRIAADRNECAFTTNRLCSDENFEYAYPQLDVRIYTPQQVDLFGDPRFFLRGGVGWKLGKSVAVKVEPVSEDVFIRSAKLEQDGVVWEAGLGVAFPLEIRGTTAQLETSVSYGQENVTASARFADDDAGRFRGQDELKLDFLKPQVELSAPFAITPGLRIEAVVGAYSHITLSNARSKQRRFRVVTIDYEKDLGFGGFVGLRFAFGAGADEV